MNATLTYCVPNTTAQATAVIPVDDRSTNAYVLKARYDEAIHHLEVMVNLNKQLQQRIAELEAKSC